MRLLVLGSGAGGGTPQWNALNANGRAAFERDPLVPFRSQCSVAVSGDGTDWALLNAAPDLRHPVARATLRAQTNRDITTLLSTAGIHALMGGDKGLMVYKLGWLFWVIVGGAGACGISMDEPDVRIIRIELKGGVSDAVYRRMEAERARVAKDLRSKGAEAAERIRADADRQRTVILAEAYRDSQLLRGEGDAKASEIYGNAYKKDAEFYGFYRSLLAYRQTFKSKDDVIVIEPDAEFFRYFKSTGAKR